MRPYSASRLRIDGVEYQIEMRRSEIKGASSAGALPRSSPTSTSAAPCLSET
jgi:hypothetical protein